VSVSCPRTEADSETPSKTAENPPVWPTHTGRNPPVPVGKCWQAIGDSRMASGRSRLRVAVRTLVKTRKRARRIRWRTPR
jgi:hypothetical protein